MRPASSPAASTRTPWRTRGRWSTRSAACSAVRSSPPARMARYLAAEGVEVVEVIRPNRQDRRRRGKSDPADAVAAALATLNGEASGRAKAHDGAVESL